MKEEKDIETEIEESTVDKKEAGQDEGWRAVRK